MLRSVDARWVLLILAYFAVQTTLRATFGSSLNWDEAEALFWARRLDWGYGPQPPLYFWLQWGVFQILGPTVLALTLLKNLLLAIFVLSVFVLLRREVNAWQAGAGSLSLGLILALSWEGQRALTHTTIALVFSTLTAWALLRAMQTGWWRDYLILGLAVGFGAMSKLNLLIWVAGLLFAALWSPEWRTRPRPNRLLGAVSLAVAMNVPVLLWMLQNPLTATSGVKKLNVTSGGGIEARFDATWSLAVATLTFLALPVLVLGIAWMFASRGRPPARLPSGIRLLGFGAVGSIAVLLAGILIAGATRIDYMWLLPFAWPLVPAATLALWPRLTNRARMGLLGASATAWLLAMVGLPLSALASNSLGNRWLDYGPVAVRLAELEETGVPIWLSSVPLAGNLVLREPELDLSLLTAAVPDLPPENLILVVPSDDPLLASPEVAARIVWTEQFDPLPSPGTRQVTVAQLSPG